ncbi:MAG TPA: histidine kinase [Dactylosporangium sp.]|nr:histidine kinase [Dactylosporangium sp.]
MRIDLTIALVVGVVVLVTTHGAPTAGPLEPAALSAVLVACAALLLRRRHPFAAFLASSIAAEVYLVLNHSSTNGALILAAPLITLYTVAESESRRRALTIGVLAVLAFAGFHMLVKPSSWLGAENLALAALGALAVAAGDGARSRREYLAEVESRAHRAEQDREAEALRRVTEERLRIARDLHDAVGHQLALINVQAGVAAQLLESQPPRAREALSHVREAGRAALEELRDTIGLLRRPDEDPSPVDPLPGLSGLPDLVESFRRSSRPPPSSGLSLISSRSDPSGSAERLVAVETVATDPEDSLAVPTAVDLTAYRVVQESLTNACKHAGSAPVHIRLRYTPDSLEVRIDNGPAPTSTPRAGPTLSARPGPQPQPSFGHGLVGMRERVEALGGLLAAGPRPDGGFRVTAILPRSVTPGLLAGIASAHPPGIASAHPPGIVPSRAPRDAGRGTLPEAAVDRRLEARE